MIIRQATEADLEQVVVLFDAYRVWYRKESNKVQAEAFIKSRLAIKDSVIYVAESEGRLTGFTQLYPLFSSVRMKKMWLLNDLYVMKTHRGKGHSRMLIAEAKKLCVNTDACGILLETETSNDIGNRLYPSEDFHLEENNFYFWTNNN